MDPPVSRPCIWQLLELVKALAGCQNHKSRGEKKEIEVADTAPGLRTANQEGVVSRVFDL